MEAMIADWRNKWFIATSGGTDSNFPFGWVQLNSNGGNIDSPSPYRLNPKVSPGHTDPYGIWRSGFASIRWAQTTALRIPNTFQAVVLDTPIANGWVHSPYKQPVGARLARSALAAAYGQTQIPARVFANASRPTKDGILVSVIVSGATTHRTLGIRSKLGFEVLGADGVWHSTPIVRHTDSTLTLGDAPSGVRAIRYLWYMAPCSQQPYKCAVYVSVAPLGVQSGERDWLPLGPFVQSFEK